MHSLRKRLYISSILIILFMILSRLIWMQLRQYELNWTVESLQSLQHFMENNGGVCKNFETFSAVFAWQGLWEQETFLPRAPLASNHLYSQASEMLCNSPNPYQTFINWQWFMVMAIILSGVFLARILCGFWFVPLMAGAALLSRGSLLSQIGSWSGDLTLTCLFTSWICWAVHFFRTGSLISFAAASLSLLGGLMLSGAFMVVILFLPLWYLLSTRLFRHFVPLPATMKESRIRSLWGQAFAPRGLPFSHWIAPFEKPGLFGLIWVCYAALGGVVLTLAHEAEVAELIAGLWAGSVFSSSPTWENLYLWGDQVFNSWDLHYSLSLLAISAMLLKRSLIREWALWESCFFLVINFLALFLASVLFSASGLRVAASESFQVLVVTKNHQPLIYFANWLEPVILTLGIVCLYHMLKRNPGSL